MAMDTYNSRLSVFVCIKQGELYYECEYEVNVMRVEDIKKVVSLFSQKGVVFEKYSWMAQDELGTWESPAGKVAWFKDPDGNTLSVSEH